MCGETLLKWKLTGREVDLIQTGDGVLDSYIE